MIGLILAAGYGTRMRPLGDRLAKPLLPVADRPILDHLLDRIEPLEEVSSLAVVANARFFHQFEAWSRRSRNRGKPLSVLDDGSTTNDDRRGAIGDVQFALDALGPEARAADLLVVAGDHIFEVDFRGLLDAFRSRGRSTIGVERETDVEELRRCGVVELDASGRIIGFVEKPKEPKTDILSPPIYVYHRADLPLVGKFLAEGRNADAPGHFIEWLHRQVPVYAHFLSGRRYDIGNMESYRRADALFRARKALSLEAPRRRGLPGTPSA